MIIRSVQAYSLVHISAFCMQLCYVCTGKFLSPERKSCGFKNIGPKGKGGRGGGGVALARLLFFGWSKGPKKSALPNFFGFVLGSHMKPHNQAKFLCKY